MKQKEEIDRYDCFRGGFRKYLNSGRSHASKILEAAAIFLTVERDLLFSTINPASLTISINIGSL